MMMMMMSKLKKPLKALLHPLVLASFEATWRS